MIIDCISDLHGFFPTLTGGDLLIVAGDLTATHSVDELLVCVEWLEKQPYKKVVVVPGNHDSVLEKDGCLPCADYDGQIIEFLCDSGTELITNCNRLKIWGSPWTKTFKGINPKCTAFTLNTEEELNEKWNLIPNDIDILVTHSPPYGILDANIKEKHVGSTSLRKHFFRIKPKLHIYGHIHECGGKSIDLVSSICVNASIVNERYQHVNKPVRMIL